MVILHQLVICIVYYMLNSMISTIIHNMIHNIRQFPNMLILSNKVVLQNYLRDRCENWCEASHQFYIRHPAGSGGPVNNMFIKRRMRHKNISQIFWSKCLSQKTSSFINSQESFWMKWILLLPHRRVLCHLPLTSDFTCLLHIQV